MLRLDKICEDPFNDRIITIKGDKNVTKKILAYEK